MLHHYYITLRCKIFCTSIFFLPALSVYAQDCSAIDSLMDALSGNHSNCFDAPATYFDDPCPCYLIFQGAHHDWIFIEANIADRVQVLDSLGRIHPLREPVAPHIIPIPNAPPDEDVRIPPEYINYGIFALPDIDH